MPCHKDDPSIESWWENDVKGFPLCKVCTECQAESLRKYRPEILSDEQREIAGLAESDLSYEDVVEEPLDED